MRHLISSVVVMIGKLIMPANPPAINAYHNVNSLSDLTPIYRLLSSYEQNSTALIGIIAKIDEVHPLKNPLKPSF
jgi:hypothetical protein